MQTQTHIKTRKVTPAVFASLTMMALGVLFLSNFRMTTEAAGPSKTTFQTRWFEVVVSEFDGSGMLIADTNNLVFWYANPGILGRLESSTDPRILINQVVGCGNSAYAKLSNLHSAPACDSGGWLTCFPSPNQPVYGTAIIPDDGLTFHLGFRAKSQSGRTEDYEFIADTDNGVGVWNPLNMAVGETREFTLHGWTLAPLSGPSSRSCTGCGDFGGKVKVTVTRRATSLCP